jgi:hypothetical protein
MHPDSRRGRLRYGFSLSSRSAGILPAISRRLEIGGVVNQFNGLAFVTRLHPDARSPDG